MKTKLYLPILVIMLILAACAAPAIPPQPVPTTLPADSPAFPATTRSAASEAAPEFTGLPLPTEKDAYFAGSGLCVTCHKNMTDPNGVDVSIDQQWKASMMANARASWRDRRQVRHLPHAHGSHFRPYCWRASGYAG
jgi:hypothetical protein